MKRTQRQLSSVGFRTEWLFNRMCEKPAVLTSHGGPIALGRRGVQGGVAGYVTNLM